MRKSRPSLPSQITRGVDVEVPCHIIFSTRVTGSSRLALSRAMRRFAMLYLSHAVVCCTLYTPTGHSAYPRARPVKHPQHTESLDTPSSSAVSSPDALAWFSTRVIAGKAPRSAPHCLLGWHSNGRGTETCKFTTCCDTMRTMNQHVSTRRRTQGGQEEWQSGEP